MKTPVRGYKARRRFLGMQPGAIAAMFVVAALAGLWVAGVWDPIRLFRSEPQGPSTRGLVAVPVSAAPIPAYTKIVRDHLWNAKTGSLSVVYIRPDQVTPDIMRNLSIIIGRVLDHDKPAGYAFTEDDFLPKGTRPGIVGGIPTGKRAMRIPVEKAPGLVGLVPGDRFDLVATLPIDAGVGATAASGGLYGKQMELQSRMTNWQKQATVRVIVQNGDVVEPMMTRQVPVATSTMTSGLIVRTKPVQEAVIAVFPSEVARLTEALAVGADISCVPRSGRPDDPVNSVTPDLQPVSPFGGTIAQPQRSTSNTASPAVPGAGLYGAGFTSIETISGTKREIIPTPVKR